MTPRTTGQNLLLWSAALALAVLLSFLGALAKQLPGDAPINWRLVALDVITTITTLAPVVAAGFGLPRLGKEEVAALTSQVGKVNAVAALNDEADRQAGIPTHLDPSAVQQVVAAVKAEMVRDPAGVELPAPTPPPEITRTMNTTGRF